ncbi:hypothetical protein PGB28_17140 [Primorskyibacter aestuariivivens]|uniref:hypothetical protein n=1 Tax=Primorskyibacter aestuariivivens TaxID=1888912 RepID=UPI002300792A|nr:hypothetical protein [Primorskyibacter aestuariivivens]MDA7430191.1 hypothetical protein [Primorskyibacter aestuariivivens]
MADEDSNFLDELVEDGKLAEGDAKKAWKLLAAIIDDADLPIWVKDYVKRSAAAVADYDMETGDQTLLAHMLGFYKEREPKAFSGYDLDHLLAWFLERMTNDVDKGKKPNISRTAREYHEEVMNMNGTPDGVRKAYEKARAGFEENKQNELALQRILSQR